jgi:cell division protein FtsX
MMEESKMAKLEQEEKEKLEFDLAWEQKEKKILLICTLVCFVIGTVIGVVTGISEGEAAFVIFAGMWFGVGIGGAIGYIPSIPYLFKQSVKEEGFGEGIKSAFVGILIWVFIFAALGLLGFLIRLLVKNHKIRKLQKRLSGEVR